MKLTILRTLSSIILLFIFISCKDYSDLELFTKTKWIDLNNPIIEAALVGKERITGTIKVKFNDESLSEGYVQYGTDTSYSLGEEPSPRLSGAGPFQVTISGLADGTYYYRIIAIDNWGNSSSETGTFSTASFTCGALGCETAAGLNR